MRRPWIRRFGALSMALWMSVSLAERAVPSHCPEHDPLGAAMAQHAPAHADMVADGRHGGAHHCCCLEQCDCTAMPMPSAIARDPIPAALRAMRTPERTPEIGVARADTRLPFATAPPLASWS